MRMRTRLFTALFAVLLALGGAACGTEPVSTVSGSTDIVEAAEDRTWIDVRTPGEFADGHLEGAVNIDLQSPDFRDQVAELPRDGSYFLYCRSGNRSAEAARIMAELGFRDVVDGGGFTQLVEAGLPSA